jgi:corrinoid protein of di/trimethylamine methyltransferase
MEPIKELERAISNFDAESAKEAAKKVLESGIDPVVAIKRAAIAIREVGNKFQKGELFLPHLVMAGDCMLGAMEVLEKALSKEKKKLLKRGTIVLGTVHGDIHSIGKNIVAAMLKAEGFELYDLGEDVPTEHFIEKAQEVNADLIAASSLMTMTMPAVRELIEELERRGLRKKFKVIVGGGSTTVEWANEIGADGYGLDAPEAVKVAKKLLEK